MVQVSLKYLFEPRTIVQNATDMVASHKLSPHSNLHDNQACNPIFLGHTNSDVELLSLSPPKANVYYLYLEVIVFVVINHNKLDT